MGVRNGEPRQSDHGRGEIAVECEFRKHASTLGFRQARVVDDQRDTQGLVVVRPLAGESSVAEIVAVIGGVDDDGVVGEALFFKLRHEASDDVIDSADHAEVGSHVRLVFLRGVPAPEVALSIDRLLQKIRLRLIDGGVVEPRKRHFLVLVHSIRHLWPGVVTDSGPLVAVLGVRSVEADLQAERLILRLLFQELDSPVAKDLRFVPLASVRLLLEIGIAAQLATHIEHPGGRFS